MHRLIEEHPALAAVREHRTDLAERRAKLTEAIAREDERYRRRDREYRAAVEAAIESGEPPPEPPVAVNLSDQLWALNNEEEALRQERAEALLAATPELHDLLNDREAEVLAGVHDAARLIAAASRELSDVTTSRAQLARIERPGDRAAQEPVPCDPADVLAAALQGAQRLPSRTTPALLFSRTSS